MVSRPLAETVTTEHGAASSSSDEASAEVEIKRLQDKFAVYRHLVPLVSQVGALFLNAASAPPSNLIVHEAITRYSSQALYEPHAYQVWQQARESARQLLARCINAEGPSSIAFTRDTTEGLGSFIRSVPFAPGDNVVIVDAEHPNLAYGWLALRPAGLEVRQVPTIAQGVIAVDAQTLEPYVDARTRAIGISSMAFDGGQRHDVAGICAAFRPRGIHVLADVTQHVGFAAIDVRALGVSAAAFSLHKGLNCPTGIGALYVSPSALAEIDSDGAPPPPPPIVNMAAVRNLRPDLLVKADEPLLWHEGARRFEHANMSLIGVVAAEAFLRFYLDDLGPADVEAHLYRLTDVLIAESGRLGVRVVSPCERRSRAPHICILDLDPEQWDAVLKDQGVHVTLNRLGVRISFGFYNAIDDVRRFVEILEMGITRGLLLKR